MSAPARITEVTRAGLTFDVLDQGPLDGEVVVLLHGFPERSSAWREVAPLLHAQGLRTVALDQRGYSPRARPPHRRDHALELLADDVAALLGRTGPAHLVGHDWGAVVAWAVAGRHPTLVRTLTAVSVPHPAAFAAAMTSSAQALKSWYMAFFQLPLLPELAGRRGGPLERVLLRRSGMTDADLARFRTEIVEYGALPGALAWYRALPLSDRSLSRQRVGVPTTFVWSDGDVAISRRAAELCERHVSGDYELVVLQGVSHWIPTQAAPALAEAILERVIGA